tara:strand:- start:7558 stop:7992 length:435 start_codon:yes stop_codon:yes gene_type:complete
MTKIKAISGWPCRAFCNDPISKGDFCYIVYSEPETKSDLFYGSGIVHKYDGAELSGVSLNDVVEVDLRVDRPKHDEVQCGGMINILTEGVVVLKVKGENLPHNTPLYLTKKGNLSPKKKKGRPLVGNTSSSQDEDGFVQVRIRI